MEARPTDSLFVSVEPAPAAARATDAVEMLEMDDVEEEDIGLGLYHQHYEVEMYCWKDLLDLRC